MASIKKSSSGSSDDTAVATRTTVEAAALNVEHYVVVLCSIIENINQEKATATKSVIYQLLIDELIF